MASKEESLSYETIEGIAKYLLENTKYRPTIGIICGSGLGNLAKVLENQDVFPYDKIENFPVSTVKGHAGNLVFGKLAGKSVVCMQGRFHYYEGYPLHKVTCPIRVMALLGVKTMIVTNAAGAINPNFSVGDVMIIKDHINFLAMSGSHPLRGPNDERFGPRFPPMTDCYDKQLREIAKSSAKETGLSSVTKEGVYVCLGGPSYETTAEIRFLHTVGGDAVGMSTAHEVITARHCGITCLGMSLITNVNSHCYDNMEVANHAEVIEVGKKRSDDVVRLVTDIVKNLKA